MYEAHYGFTEKPFNLTPDPKYLFLSARHTEAFAHLEFGHRERGGFVVITGEVGTGKTTLARYFLSRLGAKTTSAMVLYPALTAVELLRSILDDYRVAAAGTGAARRGPARGGGPRAGGAAAGSLKDLVDALHRFLLEAQRDGRDVVLLIDEAQDLSTEVLEQIRLISNLETDTQKLIQIVLMGQSELQEMLGRRELRQLAQRVTARYHLAALDRAETEAYIRHRLEVAGGAGKAVFTRSALSAVHRLSRGVPRLVNLICDRALLGGYVHATRTITRSLVAEAGRELRGATGSRLPRPGYAALGGGAALLLGVAGLWVLPGLSSLPAGAAASSSSSLALPAAPAVATLATAAPAAAPPSGIGLDATLRSNAGGSLAGALAEIRPLWGPGPLEEVAFRAHLNQLRRLDLPVVLEMFHPQRRDTTYLALLRLDGDTAIVATAAGVRVPVRVAELDVHWTRLAWAVWRDFDGVLHHPDRSWASSWISATLARRGYAVGPAGMAEAVARFQSARDLAPDGIAGSRTLMTLYSISDYPRPHLSKGAS